MTRPHSFISSLPFVTGIALLSACSNSGSSAAPTLACGAPSGQVALAYPAPNSTGIPDNFQGIVFASSAGLSASYEAFVVPAGSSSGTLLGLVAPAPSPLPSPNAAPPFANPQYQESASNGYILPAATQISVYLNNENSNCVPTTLLGTFTTQ